ncbi:MAG TPA: TonB family protein [Pyrinomonadaceae bacterium]|jgi:protein TonB
MLKRINPTLLALLLAFACSSSALGQLSFRSTNPGVSFFSSLTETDRDRDGLVGPVRRVRTETAKLTNKGGKMVEGPHAALETAAYDIKGTKIENAYFPVVGATLTGKEVYKYDEKGNIVEMTLQDANGTLLSKEVYTYEFDNFGNWTKMTTSVAVIEGGKLSFEPTEVTYRTITYYLDEATLAKMNQPAAPKPAVVNVPVPSTATPGSLTAPSVANNAVTNKPASATTDASLTAAPPPSAASNVSLVKTSAAAPDNTAKAAAEAAPKQVMARPPVKPISGGVLNGKATSLPVPSYPPAARSSRASGLVVVEVVIDGAGKVISAKALSGHALLQQAAVQAAQQARFTPTLLSGQPVKVSGTINYNFALQ